MNITDRNWPTFDWASLLGPYVISEIHFSVIAFAIGFIIVIGLALCCGHQIYRVLYVVGVAIAALFQIAWGLICGLMAWYAARFGLSCLDSHEWWSWSNALAAACFGFALWAVMACVAGIAQALPGVLPRQLSPGPGSSRLATRAEQRRGGII